MSKHVPTNVVASLYISLMSLYISLMRVTRVMYLVKTLCSKDSWFI